MQSFYQKTLITVERDFESCYSSTLFLNKKIMVWRDEVPSPLSITQMYLHVRGILYIACGYLLCESRLFSLHC